MLSEGALSLRLYVTLASSRTNFEAHPHDFELHSVVAPSSHLVIPDQHGARSGSLGRVADKIL